LNIRRFTLLGLLSMLALFSCTEEVVETVSDDGIDWLVADIELATRQNNFARVDSLLNVGYQLTDSTGNKTHRALIYSEHSFFLLITGNYAALKQKLDDTKEFIFEHGEVAVRANWYIRSAAYYSESADFDNALGHIDLAEEFLEGQKNKDRILGVRATRASILGNMYRYAEAIELYQELIQIYLDDGTEDERLATLYNNVGLMLAESKRFDDALEMHQKSYQINERLGSEFGKNRSLTNIALSYQTMGDIDRAIEIFEQLVESSKGASFSPLHIRYTYNLANQYLRVDRLDEAKEYFQNGYSESEQRNFPPGMLYHASGLMHYYHAVNDHQRVLEWAEITRNLANRLDNLELLAKVWQHSFQANESLGNHRAALEMYKKYTLLNDSLLAIQSNLEIDRVRGEFRLNIITTENELLRTELQLAEERSQARFFILMFTLFGIAVVGILLGLVIRQKKVIQEKNTSLENLIDSRDTLVRVIVHDLRSPLTGILSCLEILREYVDDTNETKELLDIAEMGGEKLKLMINGLLDASSIEKEDVSRFIETIKIEPLVNEIVENYRLTSAHKSITVHVDVEDFKIDTFSEYMSRIIDNLLSNAIKFSPIGGHVWVVAKRESAESWYVEIRDQGDGFTLKDKEDAFKLFQKLSSRPTGGEISTGLGLYIVRLLTEKLGGTVEILSKKGEGAIIRCRFN
jgi:signal transduction histidine kinase